ncbi:MAG TPA: response regulator transcription factor [Vicinamibacterales bacterium]|nr:response regulator transcription factor [Vicinamibacterales bacterium]
MSTLRLLVVDDHTLVRQGLRRILEEQPGWTIVGEAADGRAAVQQAIDLQPDVTIMDIAMPQLNGLDATEQLTRRLPNARILMLSMYADEAYVTRAVRAGALGYLTKDAADTDLVQAVTAVSEGKSYFSPPAAKVLLDDYVRQLNERGLSDRYDTLSEREREVFQLIAEGRSNKEIAALLNISPTTVETHRARIMEKLDLHSTAEIVLCAVRKGIVH